MIGTRAQMTVAAVVLGAVVLGAVVLGAVVLGAVVLAACAGSSAGPEARPATTTTTAPSTTTTTRPVSPPSQPPVRKASPDDLSMPGGAIVVRTSVPVVTKAVDGTLRTPDGRLRTYHVYVPHAVEARTTGARVPLLIALHGGTGWGLQFERNSGFDGLAEANRFIVVYPDGIGTGPGGTSLRTWNGGACCGSAVRQNVDDVTFIRLLIAHLRSRYAVDPARVFASGHSNGGIMAYRLACELSDQIAAIGVQSSALEVSACRPTHPVSVLHIHGSGDQNIPIDGGVGPKALSGVAFHRPSDGTRSLATADRCPSRPARIADADNADLTITSWSPCGAGTQVAFVEVAGATHAWMGHTSGGSGKVGPPYAKLDSNLVIWNFLSQHRRG